MILLAPFLSIVFWRVVQILQQCGYANANILTTIKDSCFEFSAFVQHSRMYRMYVKSEKHIFCHKCRFSHDSASVCQNSVDINKIALVMFKGALVFSNKKLFQSFLQKMCINVANQLCFGKSLLLIITDGRIKRMQMIKKNVFLPCRFGIIPIVFTRNVCIKVVNQPCLANLFVDNYG